MDMSLNPLAIMNNASMNIHIHVFVWAYVNLAYN